MASRTGAGGTALTSTLAASTTELDAAVVSFLGAGALSASTTSLLSATALFAGVGSLSALLVPPTIDYASCLLSGVSRICAFAEVLIGTRGVVQNVSRTGPGTATNTFGVPPGAINNVTRSGAGAVNNVVV